MRPVAKSPVNHSVQSCIILHNKEYKKCRQDIEDSLAMLEEENDEEMREMIKETLGE